MSYALRDLLDIPKLQSLLDTLDEIHSLPSAIIDTDGNILTATAWQDICTKFHRANPETELKCKQSDSYIAGQLDKQCPNVVYQCPFGLVDTATPIIVEGRHLGNVFTGQLFTEPPDEQRFRDQAVQYGFDEPAYLEAFRRVPVISEERLRKNLKFLGHFAEMLATQGLTIRRQFEQEAILKENAERHRAVVQTAMDGFWLTDADGRLKEVNETYCRMSGYSEQELLTMRISDLEALEVASDTATHMQRIIELGEDRFESRHRRRDGSTFDVAVNVQYRPVDGGRCVAFVQDITARKEAQQRRETLEAQLRQSQKLESVGLLAGGVAHDFNNMLAVILGNTELALSQVDPSQSLHADLMEVLTAAQRSAGLTRQLLAFARKQHVVPKVLDLNETVPGMLTMLRRLIGEDIEVVWQPAAVLWPITIDPSQMDQILTNLCVNARSAIADVGTLVIGTSNAVIDEAFCASHADAAPGEFVLLTVRDSGSGMDAATLAKIFEPFFTTREKGEGTGLGLATVYGAVRQNNGFITVTSALGQGSTFEIYLPRHRNVLTADSLS